MRTLLSLIVVCLLVTAAGCGALESTDDREPYGVDEEVEPEALSGLTDDEVTSSYALQAEHVETLENESYQQTERTTATNGSGDLFEDWSVTRTVEEGGAPALVEAEVDGQVADSLDLAANERWTDGERSYVRFVDGSGNVTYSEEETSVAAPTMPFPLVDVYDAVDTVEPEGDGYRLRGTSEDVDNYETLSVNVTLTREGVVDSYHVEGTDTRAEEAMHFEHHVEVEVAPVDLEEPAWLEEAKDEAESEP